MFSSRFNPKNASKVKLCGIYGHFCLHKDCKNAQRSQFLDKQGHAINIFKWTREVKTSQKCICTFTSII